jgi:hypothetical protein
MKEFSQGGEAAKGEEKAGVIGFGRRNTLRYCALRAEILPAPRQLLPCCPVRDFLN